MSGGETDNRSAESDAEFDGGFHGSGTGIPREQVLEVALDGFEGPLDLLLALSRSKKIDLTQLSMAELAQQYIGYIERMRSERLEIAADYLVMAAWLAFLKSKLMLPADEEEGDALSGDELAARLAFRLKRLAAMRQAGQELMARDQLNQDFFACGAPAGFDVVAQYSYKADFYGLLKAYAVQRTRTAETGYKVKRREVWSIKKARQRLQMMLGMPVGWAPISELIAAFLGEDKLQKTTVASTFGATLEMARDGMIELRQTEHFTPLYIKSVEGAVQDEAVEDGRDGLEGGKEDEAGE